jgi:hypothetical protein
MATCVKNEVYGTYYYGRFITKNYNMSKVPVLTYNFTVMKFSYNFLCISTTQKIVTY